MDDEKLMQWMIKGGWISALVRVPPDHSQLVEWARLEWESPLTSSRDGLARTVSLHGLYWRPRREPAAEPPNPWVLWYESPPHVGAEIEWKQPGWAEPIAGIAGRQPPRPGIWDLLWRYAEPKPEAQGARPEPPPADAGQAENPRYIGRLEDIGGHLTWREVEADETPSSRVVPPGVILKLAEPGRTYARIVHAWHSPDGTFYALDALGRVWLDDIDEKDWREIVYPPGCDPNG